MPRVVWADSSRLAPIEVGNVTVGFDGHVYNAADFSDFNGPSALVAGLYEKFGFPGALSRINGDFAVAVHDKVSGEIWLGRDRLGVKPLYYAVRPDLVAFASRPGALLAIPALGGEINPAYVARYAGLHYRYFDSDPDQSPYRNISQVPAGSWVSIRNGQVRTSAYWSVAEAPDFAENENELAERYRNLLLDAVRSRLRVSQRPAFTLSGGMDSSSVLGCAVRLSEKKQFAFSSVYQDKTFDETDEIRSMLDSTVERWYPVKIEPPDVFAVIRRMIEAHDEPVATATWLSHFLLCEQVQREGFRSMFGGLGGDELNAGEYEHYWYFFADLRVSGNEQRLAHEIETWARHHDHPIHRKSREIVDQKLPMLADLTQPGRCLPDLDRFTRYVPALNPEYFDLRNFQPIMPRPFGSYLKNRTYQDLTRETTPCCLRAEDRHGAAFGLDHFLPFLDYRLVEFMFRVPGGLKIRDGVSKTLLREAMRGILPDETRSRVKKTGWNAPAHLWFSGKGGEVLQDMVASRRFRERGVYRIAEVERIVREHEEIVSTGAAVENHMMFLWQLVNLELWFEALEQSPHPRSLAPAVAT